MLATVADMTRRTKTHGPTTKTVAANVRRLREGQGLSVPKLSARTEELGYDIPVEAIRKIEAAADGRPGARHVNADELVVLALALGANPSALLLPPVYGYQQTVQITGHGEIDATTAWRWADGKQPLVVDPTEREGAEFYVRARPVEYRRQADVMEVARAQQEGREPRWQAVKDVPKTHFIDSDGIQHPIFSEDQEETPPDGADT